MLEITRYGRYLLDSQDFYLIALLWLETLSRSVWRQGVHQQAACPHVPANINRVWTKITLQLPYELPTIHP